MDLRRSILDASLKLISSKGLEALSLREVARRLKVTHGAPYYHFKDRAEIFAALAHEGLELLTQELSEAVALAGSDPFTALQECGMAYVRFAMKRSAYFKVMYRPELAGREHKSAIDETAAGSFQVLLKVIERCQDEGAVPELDSHALALTAWATAHGVAALCVDGKIAEGSDADAMGRTVGQTLAALISSSRPPRAPAHRRARRNVS